MKSISIQLCLVMKVFGLLLFVGCQPTPTYNPFDNQFYVSSQKLVQDGCDTIMAGCGYFNIIQNKGRLRTYYQFYDSQSAVAKGMFYAIDTLKIKNYQGFYEDKTRLDSLLDLPFDIADLDKELKMFGYRYLERNEQKKVGFIFKQVKIINEETQDTICMSLDVDELQYRKGSLVRSLNYHTAPKKSQILMYEDRPFLSLEVVSRMGDY